MLFGILGGYFLHLDEDNFVLKPVEKEELIKQVNIVL
jgi:hypothetical protein